MQTQNEADQPVRTGVPQQMRRSRRSARWIAALLATLTLLAIWVFVSNHPYVDADSSHYQAMAEGRPAMKPFAFRVLGPALAHLFADVTGKPAADGFLILGLLSEWVLLYGVLRPVLERRQDIWLVILLILTPFWLRNLTNYFLPDLMHAALCMVYIGLLRMRRWGLAAAMLPVMFLERESTLLIAMIAVPSLWWLVGRRAGLLQLGGTLAGMTASKFAARHALANQHNISDTLYMIGKIPWNASRNIFGITLWSNTLPVQTPVRIWQLPSWLPLGGIHQVGYSRFAWLFPMLTAIAFLTSFGLGSLISGCLVWLTPLRKLLPRDEPYLCIAAIYGAVMVLTAPMSGAALPRLFDYGWPLFLIYLPAMIPRVWRNWPVSTVFVLVSLHLIAAWTEMIRMTFFRFSFDYSFAVLIGCNAIGLLLLWRTGALERKPSLSAPCPVAEA
ncbi:MAG: hypothetical protein DMG68_00415 [Acidobacteria bacterium]|nr:MAG: hypothetical protein DMG68_00415 [Acidobacteriota bacterium]